MLMFVAILEITQNTARTEVINFDYILSSSASLIQKIFYSQHVIVTKFFFFLNQTIVVLRQPPAQVLSFNRSK